MVGAHLRNDFTGSEIADLNVDLATAHAQQGQTNEAVASFAEALPLAADRAVKARIITAAAPLAGALEEQAELCCGRCPVPGRGGPAFCRTRQCPGSKRRPCQGLRIVSGEAVQHLRTPRWPRTSSRSIVAGRTREAVPYLARRPPPIRATGFS